MSSYIKFLSRNKLYSIIEAIGLTVSLAFVVIIFCYVTQHIAITRENPNRKEIYCVALNDITLFEYGMKKSIGESIPEIEAVTECGFIYGTEMKADDDANAKRVGLRPRLFQLFSCPIVRRQTRTN